MRKVSAVLMVVGLVLLLAIAPVAAAVVEEENSANEKVTFEIEEVEEEEGLEPGDEDPTLEDEEQETEESEEILTPDSPFYFFKRFIESVRLLLTFDQESKVALLNELAEERAKELALLGEMFDADELTEEQLAMLEKVMDDLVLFTEQLVDEIDVPEANEEDEADGDENEEDEIDGDENEEDEIDGEENEEDVDGEENEEDIEDEEAAQVQEMDKYEWRIAHLQSIADRAPESAQKGLARAIANAQRQRARAIAKGKLPADDVEDVEEEVEEIEIEGLVNEDLQEIESPDVQDKKVKANKQKVKKNASRGKGKGRNK